MINLFYIGDYIDNIPKSELKYCFKNLIKNHYTSNKLNYIELEKEFERLAEEHSDLSNRKLFLLFILQAIYKYCYEMEYTYSVNLLNELVDEIETIEEKDLEEYLQVLNLSLFDDSNGDFGIISNIALLLDEAEACDYLELKVALIGKEFDMLISPYIDNFKINENLLKEHKSIISGCKKEDKYKKFILDITIKEYFLLMIQSYFSLVTSKGEGELQKRKHLYALVFSDEFANNFLDINTEERKTFIEQFVPILKEYMSTLIKGN